MNWLDFSYVEKVNWLDGYGNQTNDIITTVFTMKKFHQYTKHLIIATRQHFYSKINHSKWYCQYIRVHNLEISLDKDRVEQFSLTRLSPSYCSDLLL